MVQLERMAELFEIVCTKYDGAELGKKAAQKIFYFMERKGLNLNLRYGIHFYGPYSAKLDDIMYELESEGYLSINTEKTTHVIRMGENRVANHSLSESNMEIVNHVLDTFEHKTPLELEALSTMDYIANSKLSDGLTEESIVKKFKEIKGNKFSEDIIRDSLKELKDLELIG